MIKMEHQGLSAKLNGMGMHEILCHKFMSDEGPSFRKKVCCLKTATGEANTNPTFKELLNLAALEHRETVMTLESRKQVNQTGGAQPKRDRTKKKKGFIKCYLCGANGHKSNAKVAFTWDDDCEHEFTQLKEILCSPLFLCPFDSNLETSFSVDTSNIEGTGFILMQEDEEKKTRVVCCGSVAAKKSWKSLSPLESEAVRICWSAKSLGFYLCGAPVIRCIVDHCPLQTLMTAPLDLETLLPRMLRACLELSPYHIEFVLVPG